MQTTGDITGKRAAAGRGGGEASKRAQEAANKEATRNVVPAQKEQQVAGRQGRKGDLLKVGRNATQACRRTRTSKSVTRRENGG